MPIKEYQIVEFFLGPALKDEVMKIMPVQKQTRAGQRTRFKVKHHCKAPPAAWPSSNSAAIGTLQSSSMTRGPVGVEWCFRSASHPLLLAQKLVVKLTFSILM
jgi:Ribosomal protein S5, N-terminal domain